MKIDFSVLMSVYKNTDVQELKLCLDSLINQTVLATELVMVIDGEIGQELHDFLNNNNYNLKLVPIDENVGLGRALQTGLNECLYEIVARMDTDDICLPDRFEKQLREFGKDSELSIVGSYIAEFVENEENIVGYRKVPSTYAEIKEFIKKRDPMNHMTVMFKKSAVIAAGGYKHWHYNEDYYLWLRMFLNNAKFYNVPEVLVKAKVGVDMYKRRGGYKYFKSEAKLQKFMLQNKIINLFRYLYNITIRFVVQVLMPNSLRGYVFKKFAREKN